MYLQLLLLSQSSHVPLVCPRLSAKSYCNSSLNIHTIAGIIVATWKLLHVAVGIWTDSSRIDNIRLRIRI